MFKQPDGTPATLKFITVGGRTSAYIEELQKLPDGVVYKEPVKRGKVGTCHVHCSEHLVTRCLRIQAVKDVDDVGPSSEDLSDAPVEEPVVKASYGKPVKRTKRVTKKSSMTAKQEEGLDGEQSSDLSEVDQLDTGSDVKPVRCARDPASFEGGLNCSRHSEGGDRWRQQDKTSSQYKRKQEGKSRQMHT